MNFKKIGVALATLGTTIALASCGGGNKSGGEISLWVGNESVNFYKEAVKDFLAQNSNFGYSINVVAADTGTIAGSMVSDNTACGDIITVAHDNIGKLAQRSLIKPLTDEGLLQQIEDDNPETYKDVIRSTMAESTDKYVFGSPYISQALFLMYNKQYVTEEQAKTFEGLKEAALALRETDTSKKGDIHGCTLAGTDGYNFSFTLLARKVSDNSTTLKIYEGLEKANCYCQGDDTVAVTRWAQDAFRNGTLEWPNDSGYATMMQTHTALAVVGGAWHYNAVVSAIGAENVGLALIPTFTLTADHVAETTVPANTQMRGGTFADCKCFVINGASDGTKYAAEQQLIKYLSSKDVQNKSFKEALNVPAYKDAMNYIESVKDSIEPNAYKLAKVQSEMGQFGIPQPFVTATLNNYYYQAGAPDLYKNLIIIDDKTEGDGSLRKVREVLFTIEYIWKWGNGTVDKLVIPEVLPGDTSTKAS